MPKKESIYKYDHEALSTEIMKITEAAEDQVREAYTIANTRKAINIFQAGYRTALRDYGIFTAEQLDPKPSLLPGLGG